MSGDWHQVVISAETAGATAKARQFWKALEEAWAAAGAPAGVEIYRCHDADMRHIYVLSPKAVELARASPELSALQGQMLALDGKPDLDGFVQLRI
jgi:hypothetical protein